jgi:hypothetical protein
MFGFDLPIWAILLIIAALIALVFAILNWLYAKAQAAISGSGSTPAAAPPPPPPPPYAATLARVQELLARLTSEQRPPTDEECRLLREALAQARTEGVPESLVAPMQAAIDQLCD